MKEKINLSIEKMQDMSLNSIHWDKENDVVYRRVPGGWIYYVIMDDTIVNSTFVPFSNV